MSSSRPSTPSSRSSKRARPTTPSQARNPVREELKSIQQETESILPAVLKKIRRRSDAHQFERYTLNDLPRLSPNDCPSFPKPATIRVINKDTFDAAIEMTKTSRLPPPSADKSSAAASSLATPEPESRAARKRPAVVNFANRHEPGGGWLNGAMAQEEALFYRSSLSLSLKKDIVPYPLKTPDAVYSPHVFIIRTSYADGHQLLVQTSSGVYSNGQKGLLPAIKIDEQLPEVSVLTVAAIYGPEVEQVLVKSRLRETRTSKLSLNPAKPEASSEEDQEEDSDMSGTPETESSTSESPEPQEQRAVTPPPVREPLPGLPPNKQMFKYNRERNLTKDKMRLVLRMAASKGHTSIVLGALGCGAFRNPPEDVANCWLEVLREDEFSGNWWEEVVFAVLDSGESQDGNYHIFRNVLDEKEV